ncbi:MAG: regulatory iron-sulfur-containing complex subunit RicT [Nitrospiraceae bacterium]|nr:regulatory iron-sulfur-containing complex subunit RicT [Nitrospiraceae bacterium]
MTDNMMPDTIIRIAGVRFRDNWKVYDFDATDIEVAIGEKVIVDSERGQGLAFVVRLKKQQALPATEPVQQEEHGLQIEEEIVGDASRDAIANGRTQAPKTLKKVVRKATEEDLARDEKNKVHEAEAFKTAQDMIAERELPMKLIRVEYSFDASRATFYFFSESRVDFRELVKDLAHKLHSRIEMRQIGVRDVARLIGGFGPCGRELCCAAFLKNFEPVSIRMAKKQEMVLNPAKISGVCGRLLCCLSYEYEMYDEIKKDVAGMREAVLREKRAEEEQRIGEERREAEERRLEEEKRRQEDRKQQDQRRDRQKDGGQKGGRPEKRRDQQQEKKAQPQQPGGQPRERQQQPQQQKQQQKPQQRQQQKQEKPEPQEQLQEQITQSPQQPQQEGEKSGRKKKRRFWRKKKKGGGGGENKPPQGPAGS